MLLTVSDTPETQFLLQAELKAIQSGLEYIEKQFGDFRYKGYVNEDGQFEGVGMKVYSDGKKVIGEFHHGKLNGCAKIQFAKGQIFWGEFKDDKEEGYGTADGANGLIYTGELM